MKDAHQLRNEFATVEVTISTDRGAQTVRIRNPETGEDITLDALELEALTRMTHHDFGPLILRDGGDD